jgi:flagellar hook-basal body complex protein FliE
MTMPVNALSSALQQMQTMAAEASGGAESPAQLSGAATASGFAGALKASLDRISGDELHATGEAQAFEVGASNVSLSDVMIDQQKANLSLQFGLQVRNRLVSAYDDIMQMSV